MGLCVTVVWLIAISIAFLEQPAFGQVEAVRPENNRSEAQLSTDLLQSIPQTVEHRTSGIPDTERELFHRVLKHARQANSKQQQAAARRNLERRRSEFPDPDREFSLYLDMLRFPDRHLGQLVTLQGKVRSLVSRPAAQNDFGIVTLYEARLDTGGMNPAVVIVTSLPDGMPQGEDIAEPATVTGYFFKLSQPASGDGSRVAPLILAERLQWHPQTVSDSPRLNPELLSLVLSTVQDRTMGILDEERDPYYRILKHAREIDYQKQKALARRNLKERHSETKYRDSPLEDFPTFVDLFKNPERYRGKLVTLRGYLHRLETYKASKNDFGIETQHEAWLFTDKSQSNPTVIVCTSIPEGLSSGPNQGELIENVTVTGYFFKLYGYPARDAKRIAPLLLAQKIEWQPNRESAMKLPAVVVYILGCVMVGIVVWFMWRAWRTDQMFRRSRLSRNALPPQSDFTNLDSSPPGEIEFPTGESVNEVSAPQPPETDPQHEA